MKKDKIIQIAVGSWDNYFPSVFVLSERGRIFTISEERASDSEWREIKIPKSL